MMLSLASFLIVALLAGVILMAVIVQQPTARKNRPAKRSRSGSTPNLTSEQIKTRWATIQTMAAAGGNGLRQSVTEADKLLDHVLRQQGASGDTMGDRLRSARSRFSNVDGVWRAHKLRNALAHEVGFDLVVPQAKEALSEFERGLKDLGAL